MSSLILATDPERRIREVSPELADSVGSAPQFMSGADCACILRCRNAGGQPLCGGFCPALMAARSRSGIVDGLPVWLESPSDGLKRFRATFQRVQNTPSRLVVAFFGEMPEEEPEPAPGRVRAGNRGRNPIAAVAADVPAPQLRRVGAISARSRARRRPRLRLAGE